MLPEFALHHLPLYAVTLSAMAGLGFWGWVRWTLARQTASVRRDAIAGRALAAVGQPDGVLDLDEWMNEVDGVAPVRSRRRRVR